MSGEGSVVSSVGSSRVIRHGVQTVLCRLIYIVVCVCVCVCACVRVCTCIHICVEIEEAQTVKS